MTFTPFGFRVALH